MLDSTRSWSARNNTADQWMKIDLGEITYVNAIITQGRQDSNQWVEKYNLEYSIDNLTYINYPGSLTGNTDKSTKVYNYLYGDIIARWVKINIESWNAHISMRAGVEGTTNYRLVANSELRVPFELNMTDYTTYEYLNEPTGIYNITYNNIYDANKNFYQLFNVSNSDPVEFQTNSYTDGIYKNEVNNGCVEKDYNGEWLQIEFPSKVYIKGIKIIAENTTALQLLYFFI